MLPETHILRSQSLPNPGPRFSFLTSRKERSSPSSCRKPRDVKEADHFAPYKTHPPHSGEAFSELGFSIPSAVAQILSAMRGNLSSINLPFKEAKGGDGSPPPQNLPYSFRVKLAKHDNMEVTWEDSKSPDHLWRVSQLDTAETG